MMRLTQEECRLVSILAGGGSALYLLTYLAQAALSPAPPQQPFWLLTLSLNLLGYATVLLPGYLALRRARESGYLEMGIGRFASIFRLFFKGREESLEEVEEKRQEERRERTLVQDAARLLICAGGLQICFLTWGVLQEKIMTKDYVDSAGQTGRFTDAQFLVFVNRILAFALALVVIMLRQQPPHKAPLFKYSFCSFSNIMSSWCQYEALKYVSFPTQVLAKASKVIPVMAMGRLVSKKKYEFYEYLVALLISFGMICFFFGKETGSSSSSRGEAAITGSSSSSLAVTTVSGFIIMVGYMAFDAFTSVWQNELFQEYKMTSIQMMAGVNLFSCLLTSVSLLQQGVFYDSLIFMSQFPKFVSDCVLLSLCSAGGQLFIYYTIAEFGPVVFIIIMTVRQLLAVVLSCIIYLHPLSALSVLGIAIVFGALFLKIYCSYRLKKTRKGATAVKA